MAIIEYDKSPNITFEQRLRSLADSVRRAFEEVEGQGVGNNINIIEDEDLTDEQYKELWALLGVGEIDDEKYYIGEYNVTPATYSRTILGTANKTMLDDVVVSQIPQYEVSNDSEGQTLIIGKESM